MLFVNAEEDVAETFRGGVSAERHQRRSLSTREQRRGLMGMGMDIALPSFNLGSKGKGGKGDLFCETKYDPFKGGTVAECVATYGFENDICGSNFKTMYVSFTDYCSKDIKLSDGTNPVTWCTNVIDGEKCGECIAIYGNNPTCFCSCGLDARGGVPVANVAPACGVCGVCCSINDCPTLTTNNACQMDCKTAAGVNPCAVFCPIQN
jgi:hypothetical protein